jgi:DNA polymerase sigma
VRHSNDLDICLELPVKVSDDDPDARDAIFDTLTELVTKAGFVEVKPLAKARVPVIKFTIPAYKNNGGGHQFPPMRVDVTLNNMLACANTKLLADYCSIDPRLAQLVALVKHWAKKRDVNNPYMGTLSSYCYVLMCIHHLQTRSPPILPVLQEEEPKSFQAVIDGWVCDYCDHNLDRFKVKAGENKETIAQLLWTFFEYWAWLHDYGDGVATIRTSKKVTKTEKDWTKRVGTERHLLCVEDPFVVSHDLGRTVDWRTKEVLKKELTRAATVLRDLEDPMTELFRPFIAKTHNATNNRNSKNRGGSGGFRTVNIPLTQLVTRRK